MTAIDGEPSPHSDNERPEAGSTGAGGFFFPEFAARHRNNLRSGNGSRPRSQRTRSKAPRDERTLFDFVPTDSADDESPPAPEEMPPPAIPSMPAAADALNPPDPSPSRAARKQKQETSSPPSARSRASRIRSGPRLRRKDRRSAASRASDLSPCRFFPTQ
jgi:hypothetical protein